MKHTKLFVTMVLGGAILLLSAGCAERPQTPEANPPSDDAPPLPPTGLSCPKLDGQGFTITWTPNRDANFRGYRVYLFDPDPYQVESYRLVNESELFENPRFVYNGEMDDWVWLRVSSVDNRDRESALSEPFGVAPLSSPEEPTEQDPGSGRDGRGDPRIDSGESTGGREDGEQYPDGNGGTR